MVAKVVEETSIAKVQEKINEDLLLNPYFLSDSGLTHEQLIEHPDMEGLLNAARSSLTKDDEDDRIDLTMNQLVYVLLRCKYTESGKWVTAVEAYSKAYPDSYSRNPDRASKLANALETKSHLRGMINHIRNKVIAQCAQSVISESVAIKSNRVKRQSESWERLREMRDTLLPPPPVLGEYPTHKEYLEAVEEHKETLLNNAKLWSMEIARIEKAIGEIEDRTAAELSQRTQRIQVDKNVKGYIGFDPEAV